MVTPSLFSTWQVIRPSGPIGILAQCEISNIYILQFIGALIYFSRFPELLVELTKNNSSKHTSLIALTHAYITDSPRVVDNQCFIDV